MIKFICIAPVYNIGYLLNPYKNNQPLDMF